jgi:hypothetical protein
MSGPRQGELDPDGTCRTAGAQDDRTNAGDGSHRGHRLEETFAVGVVADQLAVAMDHTVDRTDRLGGRAESVQVLDDGDLVRDREIEPSPVHRPGAPDGVREAIGTDLDGQVAPVEPHVGERRLDHRLRRILGDREAEDADEFLLEGARGGHDG